MTTIGADETVIQEITIKASAKRIFEALTNPEQRKEWAVLVSACDYVWHSHYG